MTDTMTQTDVGGIQSEFPDTYRHIIDFIHAYGISEGVDEPENGWDDEATLKDMGFDSDIGIALITAMENQWEIEFDPDQFDKIDVISVNKLASVTTQILADRQATTSGEDAR
jgi:acyl carrier protein